jgi:hypothetical protein
MAAVTEVPKHPSHCPFVFGTLFLATVFSTISSKDSQTVLSEEAMKRLHVDLIVVSVLFIALAEVGTYLAYSRAKSRFDEDGDKIARGHPDVKRVSYIGNDMSDAIREMETVQLVNGVAVSLFTGLGVLLIVLYLKIRDLERSIVELRRNDNKLVDPGTPPGLRLGKDNKWVDERTPPGLRL